MRLTPLAKGLITFFFLVVLGVGLYLSRGKLAPAARDQAQSSVPPAADLPGVDAGIPAAAASAPGCANLPEVRFYLWAWNAQMGIVHATGGPQATADSAMCKNGVNLKLIREDNTDTMQSLMVAFAEDLKGGKAQPVNGANFVAIMGDGSANFLKGLNDSLTKLGPDYRAVVVGSSGYSRGEDKFMGPPAWKENPQKARGGLVAGYLRDGDWNIALKWLGDNQIPNNPDDTTYDPNALNWVAASDYIDAAQKYVTGFCVDLKNKATGATEKHCVDGVVTWTPGDVTVAEQKGGLTSIVSTNEYRSQMPNVIIGNQKWMSQNREIVKGMLKAIFDSGDLLKKDDSALRRAAAISAQVYAEKDGAYWYKYFTIQRVTDKAGVAVELGGSSVNNLADNLNLFGLSQGSTNLFAATYIVFANIVKSQYPDLLASWYPVDQILDTSYIQEIAAASPAASQADLATFRADQKVEQVISHRTWKIEFKSGSAQFTPQATEELKDLLNDLLIAGGTLVEVHGHTDNQGGEAKNMQLSEDRAFAVKSWLEQQSPANFPPGRVKVFSHGATEPLESNSTGAGRAANRRVEIVMGTAKG